MALACSFALCACEPKSETLPSEMLQVWRSDEPRYIGRYFELRDNWVIFGTGAALSDMHVVEHVTSEANPEGGRRYTIQYRAEDGTVTSVQVIHHPGPRPTLKFANHDEVWTPRPISPEGI
jgi:hypothetical protein